MIGKALVACEESQAVCIALRAKGWEAYSCDILPCSGGHPEWHIQGDALEVIYSQNWDMLLGHPPCTYLSYAATGSWNNPGRLEKRLEALNFFAKMWLAPIHFICLENPKSCASPTIAKYSQEIHPYYFGDPELKTTWLWLKNLPLLKDTNRLEKPKPKMIIKNGKKIYWSDSFSLSKDRGHLRSKTFPGIASAMADQWTDYYLKTVCEL